MTKRRPSHDLAEGLAPGRPLAPVLPLDTAALRQSLSETLAVMPADEVWLFAYGSLMWAPCFAPAERRPAVLDGWHRSFNFWSTWARGTPDCPGLGLGLALGGSCRVIAYRLDPASREADVERVWAREMYTAVYRPRWLPLLTEQGAVDAICFVSDPSHPRYAGELDPESAATAIAAAAGTYGTCRDYLAGLIEALAQLDADEPPLNTLLARVDALRLRASGADG